MQLSRSHQLRLFKQMALIDGVSLSLLTAPLVKARKSTSTTLHVPSHMTSYKRLAMLQTYFTCEKVYFGTMSWCYRNRNSKRCPPLTLATAQEHRYRADQRTGIVHLFVCIPCMRCNVISYADIMHVFGRQRFSISQCGHYIVCTCCDVVSAVRT